MVLDSYRHVADAVLDPMAKGLANISPNTLSAIAFGAAVLAGLAFYLGGGLFLGLEIGRAHV